MRSSYEHLWRTTYIRPLLIYRLQSTSPSPLELKSSRVMDKAGRGSSPTLTCCVHLFERWRHRMERFRPQCAHLQEVVKRNPFHRNQG